MNPHYYVSALTVIQMTTYERLIQHFKGVPNLAKALGVKPQAVYMWAGVVPENRAYQIEVITSGAFKAKDFIESNMA